MFDEKTYICKTTGRLYSYTHEKELLALRIKNDSVNISGHSFIKGDNIKLCKKDSKRYLSEDEYAFTNDGCNNVIEVSDKKVIFGSFNLITTNLFVHLYEYKRENIKSDERKYSYSEWKCEKKKDN
jgi:hypothetical protein